jgi:hypothetical protein
MSAETTLTETRGGAAIGTPRKPMETTAAGAHVLGVMVGFGPEPARDR